MSCDIRIYNSMNGHPDYGNIRDMALTAFSGGKNGLSVQFTIGGYYCQLNESAIRDLIDTLQKRLKCLDGYNATGDERNDIVFKE